MRIAKVPAEQHVAEELSFSQNPRVHVVVVPHVQGDVHSAHRVQHSERNRFLNKDLRDFLTKDRNDLINLVVCRLHNSLVDAIFFLFVDKCPCCRGPVTGVLLHPDEE